MIAQTVRPVEQEAPTSKRKRKWWEYVTGNEILTGPGKISAEEAKLHAETEYEKYRIIQDRLYQSDFDKYLQELEEQIKDDV